MLMRNMKRDEVSGAILSTDTSALQQYKLARARQNELNTLKEEMRSVKNDMSEIKNLLKALVDDS